MKKHKNPTLSRKAADVLEVCAGIRIPQESREEEVDMCKAWDDHYKSGWKEGREEGREEGTLEHAKKTAKNLYQRNMDIPSIAEIIEQSEEQVRAWVS